MRSLRTLGATFALLCALVASVIAWRWLGPARALTPQRQLSAGALEGVVRWTGAGVSQPTAVENSTDPDVCGRMHTLEDVLVSDRNKGVKNVILARSDSGWRDDNSRPGVLGERPVTRLLEDEGVRE